MQKKGNDLLRRARLERGWSQAYVASAVEAPNNINVTRWEAGVKPTSFFQQRLCELFQMTPEQLGFIPKLALSPIYDPLIPLPFNNPQDFVGRNDLFKQIKTRLQSSESVVLTAFNGLPGVGKTALAIELANDRELQEYFHGGVLWVGLGPHPNISGAWSRWGELLGISSAKMAELRDDDAWAEAIRSAIGERHMLLIIDDAWKKEHVLTFRLGGPSCAYIITTRIPDIATYFAKEEAIQVMELEEEDAIKLLERWVKAVVDTKREKIEALVRVVGGLPLALKLIGSYLLLQTRNKQPHRVDETLDKLLHSIEERLNVENPQGGLEHHTALPAGTPITLQAVIGVSYKEALYVADRQALQALSIFPAKPNAFSIEAALAIAATSIETLNRLEDSGLMEISEPGRYTLHQTIADYAKTKHVDRTALERMAEYFARYVERYEKDSSALEQEIGNILAALDVTYELGQRAEFVQRVVAFTPFLKRRGLYALAEPLLQRANQVATELRDVRGKVRILMFLGDIGEMRGNYEQTEAYLHEALVLVSQQSDHKQTCIVLRLLGKVTVLFRGYATAEAYYQEGLALARRIGDREEISGFLINLGSLEEAQGNYVQAEANWREALELARQIEKQEWIIALLMNHGNLASRQEKYVQAEAYYQEGLVLARQFEYRFWTCFLIFNLGEMLTKQGDYAQAEAYHQEGLTLAREMGHPERIGYQLAALGELAKRRGAYSQAEAYLQEGLALARPLRQRELICGILSIWGDVYLERHQIEQAEATFCEMRDLLPEGNQELAAQAQYGLAKVAVARGNIAEARKFGEASLAILDAISHPQKSEVKQWLSELPHHKKKPMKSASS